MTTWSKWLADELKTNVRQRRKDCVKESCLGPTHCDDRQGMPARYFVGK